ncbi:MAG: tannase/feruloyl esterase family alpha/beta hydrolase [Alphaproteobacteria bacterium]
MYRILCISLAAILFAFASLAPALAADCAKLANLKLENAKIDKAELVAAGAFEPPPSPFPPPPGVAPSPFKGMPAFCRVRATLTPSADSDIKIEVWLPAKNWNGKLDGIGNGVWAGSISYFQLADPLSRGYAAAATDTGHVGTGLDAGFAVGHPEKLTDFGYRAVHEMTVKAKALIAAYYNKGPDRSYWTSCSTGGRQGLMEAYRYPEDYNGISSMDPANPMTMLMTQSLWTGYAALKDAASTVPPSKLAALHKAYLDKCDAADGVKDGLVSDPEHCSFDPKLAQCKAKDGPDCLTKAQVATMRAVYGGIKNPRTGKQLFAGFEPGSEAQVGLLMSGPEPFPVATSYMRDIVFKDPKWDFNSFDYDKDVAKAHDAGAQDLDVPSDGLSKFFARGGKLFLAHGWSDGLIPAGNTVAFYKAMLATLDDKTRAAQARLFMIPGMGHCAGGEGPFVFDPLSVIDNWSEESEAPERIVVSKPPDAPAMTRPLCPYPQIAKYKGAGSTDDAANFECANPGKS